MKKYHKNLLLKVSCIVKYNLQVNSVTIKEFRYNIRMFKLYCDPFIRKINPCFYSYLKETCLHDDCQN